MQLSKKAKEDLRKVLVKETGADVADSFSDEELNRIGELLLTILVESLKMEISEIETQTSARKAPR